MAINGICKLLAFYLVIMSVSKTKECFAGRAVVPLQAIDQVLGQTNEHAVVVVGERKLSGNFEATSYPASKEQHGVVCYSSGSGGGGTSFAFGGGGEHGGSSSSSSMGFVGANNPWAAYDHHFSNGQPGGFGYSFGGGSGYSGGFAGGYAP